MTPVRCVCGNEPDIHRPLKHRWYVECPQPINQFCWLGPSRETEEEAIAAWNAVMVPAVTAKVQARNLRKLGKK